MPVGAKTGARAHEGEWGEVAQMERLTSKRLDNKFGYWKRNDLPLKFRAKYEVTI